MRWSLQSLQSVTVSKPPKCDSFHLQSPPKRIWETQIPLRFLGISRYEFKLRFWFNLKLYRGSWVSGFGGFGSVETVILAVTNDRKADSISPRKYGCLYVWQDSCDRTHERQDWHLIHICNTLQHIATHCSMLQHSATHSKTLHHTALTKMSHVCTDLMRQRTVSHCKTLQHNAKHCNTLQHATTHYITYCNTHCNTLQHTATRTALTKMSHVRMDLMRQHTATRCITLLHTATRTATHCDTLQHALQHTQHLPRWAPCA